MHGLGGFALLKRHGSDILSSGLAYCAYKHATAEQCTGNMLLWLTALRTDLAFIRCSLPLLWLQCSVQGPTRPAASTAAAAAGVNITTAVAAAIAAADAATIPAAIPAADAAVQRSSRHAVCADTADDWPGVEVAHWQDAGVQGAIVQQLSSSYG
jgi:hypothetical protein